MYNSLRTLQWNNNNNMVNEKIGSLLHYIVIYLLFTMYIVLVIIL